MHKIGIVGGTGYTGVELLRLLTPHTEVELTAITSRSEAGRRLDDLYPNLRGHTDLCFVEPTDDALAACDLVFFATPHGVAMRQAPGLLARGIKVVDLSADYRLQDLAVFSQWYGMQHESPEWVAKAVYGLPEIARAEIADAQLVAAPGCYPTAVQLALLPLLNAGAVDASDLIADCKSGVSGAGRGPTSQPCSLKLTTVSRHTACQATVTCPRSNSNYNGQVTTRSVWSSRRT